MYNDVGRSGGRASLGVFLANTMRKDMKKRFACAVLCVGVVGCRPDATTATFQPGLRSSVVTPSSAIRLSPEESKLISELVSSYPVDKREIIVNAFSDPFMIGAKTPQNARNQAIIDRIDAIRRARIDSMAKAEKAGGPGAVSATVILLPTLPDSTATAVVWRRAGQVPHDIIALPAGRVTVGSLGAAVRVLTKLRRESGDSARKDEHAVVHGEYVPRQWQGDMRAFVLGDLDQLRAGTPRSIQPFGIVRSREVWLAATNRGTKP